MKELVSVIVPFFNAQHFLSEAIDSVIDQTYSNWEILLVNDGSSDRSQEIAFQYITRYPEKIRYLENSGGRNCGQSASRNVGIRSARGDYIALLDSDDVWLPQKLERQIQLLVSHPEVSMLFGLAEVWYSSTHRPEDIRRDYTYVPKLAANAIIPAPELLLAFLRGEIDTPPVSNPVFRTQAILSVNGFEEAFPNLMEFEPLLVKICLKAPVFFANECWSKYRQHPESALALASRDPERLVRTRRMFLQWCESYLAQQGYRDTELWKAVQRRMWPYRHAFLADILYDFRSVAQKLLPTSFRRTLKPVWDPVWQRIRWR